MAVKHPTGRGNFWLRILRNIPTLLAMLKDAAIGGYRGLTWRSIAVIAFLAVYVINPFDLISDFLLGSGQLDDLVVLMGCVYAIEGDLERYRHWKLGNRPPGGGAP